MSEESQSEATNEEDSPQIEEVVVQESAAKESEAEESVDIALSVEAPKVVDKNVDKEADDSDGEDTSDDEEEKEEKKPIPITMEDRDAMVPTASGRVAFDDDRNYTEVEFADLLSQYESTLQVKAQQIVNGTVLAVTDTEVVVDIGFKSEGSISRSEFSEEDEIEVGSQVEVYLEDVEDHGGQVVVSKQKADFMRVWDHIKDAFDSNEPVDAVVQRRIKGGLIVDLFGVESFLPGSQIDLRQVKNFEQYIGQTYKFRIIKLNKSRRNIVVSRRVVLEEEREDMRSTLLSELEKDQVREGMVKNITDFGAFIDLGGADGLLHITDMSWGRVNHPSDAVTIGETIQVKVLNYDPERERISLGLKQLTAYPWDNVEASYPVGEPVKGKVVSITDYGAFVELEEGVEGLIHISEMSWTQHVRHPSKIVNVGDEVEAMVLRVNAGDEKISLGLKQCQPDPWDSLDERYPSGMKMMGIVRNITNFGVFVEIEHGIDGLVHISDLSWTKRVKHPSELVKKGDELEVVILSIDKDQRRISLSHKHIQENPWDRLELRYGPGTVSEGVIVRISDKGVVAEMDGDVEGFVPASQLAIPDIGEVHHHFAEGETLNMVVIEFDREQKKIVLSVSEFFEQQEQAEVDAYVADHTNRPITIAEVAGDALSEAGEEMKDGASDADESDAVVADSTDKSSDDTEASDSTDEASADEPEESSEESPSEEDK